jgi:myo-inositol 2-dehydrogenase/D-chiro-inositol 1-dehydrogenase
MVSGRHPLRVALLGCGRIARLHHLRILRQIGGASVTAIAEGDDALREAAVRETPGARPLRDYRDALSDPDIDAVVVCLPPALHADAAVSALNEEKHVYLEKPIATCAADAAAVVRAWKSSGRVAMLGFNQRFHPAVRESRELIRSGRLGRPLALRIASASPPRQLPVWKRRRADGGGVLLDLSSHHIDLARFLLGDEVAAVAATVASLRTEDDVAWLTLTMQSGVTVESRASLASAQENRFEVVGEGGTLHVDRLENRMELRTLEPPWSRAARLRREVARAAGGVRAALATASDPSYARALGAFVQAAGTGVATRPDPHDGERSLAVVLTAEAAAREQRRMPVPAFEA